MDNKIPYKCPQCGSTDLEYDLAEEDFKESIVIFEIWCNSDDDTCDWQERIALRMTRIFG